MIYIYICVNVQTTSSNLLFLSSRKIHIPPSMAQTLINQVRYVRSQGFSAERAVSVFRHEPLIKQVLNSSFKFQNNFIWPSRMLLFLAVFTSWPVD